MKNLDGQLKKRSHSQSDAIPDLWDAESADPKARRRVKREQVMLTHMKKVFEEIGAFFYKIPDMPHMPGTTRFDIEKPFDAFAVFKNRRMAIEAKALSRYQAFGIRHVRYCQEIGLDDFLEAGGESWLMVGVEHEGQMRVIPLEWRKVRERLKAGDSLKKTELEILPYWRFGKSMTNYDFSDIKGWMHGI